MKHPSDLALEEHLLDRNKHADHVAGCDRCRQRVAMMEEEGKHFRQYVYPATLEKLEAAPKRRWSWLLGPIAAAAAAAAVLALYVRQPDSDYVGTKGSALKLTIYASDGSGAHAVADGATVPANAALRFKVHASSPCELTILSLDDSGQVSTVAAGAKIAGEQTLPGGAVLDGRAGQERFFAVCAPGRIAGLEEKVKAAGVGGRKDLSDLPPGSAQASQLLVKTP